MEVYVIVGIVAAVCFLLIRTYFGKKYAGTEVNSCAKCSRSGRCHSDGCAERKNLR
ncbi:MAG: hypothetical protein SPI71_07220 [Acidaminococcaceae bacterium]|nr:hypothetical protein [Acidaminococcaceae bacterium]